MSRVRIGSSVINQSAAKPPRFALLGPRYTKCSLLDGELRRKLDSVEAEGRGIVSNPGIRRFILNIMKGQGAGRNLDMLAAAKEPAGNAFLKELLEFNLSLGEKCIRQNIEPISCEAYIDPGKILKSMVLTEGDSLFLFNLRQRVSYSPHLLISVEEALNLMDEKKKAKEKAEEEQKAQRQALEAARAERRRASRKTAKERAKVSEQEDPKKVQGVQTVEFSGLSGPLLEKWQRVEREGRILLLLRGETLGHRVRGVLRGEEADDLIRVISQIGDRTFDPFLRAFLEFHLALCVQLYGGTRLYYNEEAPGCPHPADPISIFSALKFERKDKDYLVSLYEQSWQVWPVLVKVLYTIRHNLSANDADVYGSLQKELDTAEASRNLNMARVLKITLNMMEENKKEEDRMREETEALEYLDGISNS